MQALLETMIINCEPHQSRAEPMYSLRMNNKSLSTPTNLYTFIAAPPVVTQSLAATTIPVPHITLNPITHYPATIYTAPTNMKQSHAVPPTPVHSVPINPATYAPISLAPATTFDPTKTSQLQQYTMSKYRHQRPAKATANKWVITIADSNNNVTKIRRSNEVHGRTETTATPSIVVYGDLKTQATELHTTLFEELAVNANANVHNEFDPTTTYVNPKFLAFPQEHGLFNRFDLDHITSVLFGNSSSLRDIPVLNLFLYPTAKSMRVKHMSF